MKPTQNKRSAVQAGDAKVLLDHGNCHASELLTMSQGALRLGLNLQSAYRVAAAHGIEGSCLGRKTIHKVALRLLLQNDLEGVALFRSGDRSHPRIVEAYTAEGLQAPKIGEAA